MVRRKTIKKVISIIIVILLVIGISIGVYFAINKNKVNDNADENNNRTTINNSNTNTSNGKILVVYYSAQSHTEDVAKKIANNLSADLFEIIPKDIYTSDDLNWSNENSRVSK